MVDTLALGASGSDPMEVQVLSSAPAQKQKSPNSFEVGDFCFFQSTFSLEADE